MIDWRDDTAAIALCCCAQLHSSEPSDGRSDGYNREYALAVLKAHLMKNGGLLHVLPVVVPEPGCGGR